MDEIVCCVCRKGPRQGVSVHRINAKGVPGVWACEEHLSQTDGAPLDPETQRLIRALEGRNTDG